jgi:hypothetical protein
VFSLHWVNEVYGANIPYAKEIFSLAKDQGVRDSVRESARESVQESQNVASAEAVVVGSSAFGECSVPGTITRRAPRRWAMSSRSGTGHA